jgi:hypothetical protein
VTTIEQNTAVEALLRGRTLKAIKEHPEVALVVSTGSPMGRSCRHRPRPRSAVARHADSHGQAVGGA